MKWLIVCESVDINNTSSGICNSNIINGLSAIGEEVTVLYNTRHRPEEPVWINAAGMIPLQLTNTQTDLPFYMKLPKASSIYLRLTGFTYDKKKDIAIWQRAIAEVLRKQRFDMVLLLGSGWAFSAYMAMQSLHTATPWIANIHDPYPTFELPPPYTLRDHPFLKKDADWFRSVCNECHGLAFPSQMLKEWMAQFNPNLHTKGEIIPHPGTLSLQKLPASANDDKVELDAAKFNLVHLGSLLGPRTPIPLFTAFRQFLSKHPDAAGDCFLHIIGSVSDRHLHAEKAMGEYRQNLKMVPRISYKRAMQLLELATANLIIEADAAISPFLPGKYADYMQARKPVMALSPAQSEVRRLLGAGNPLCTENGNTDEIEAIISKLYFQWKSGKPIPLNYDESHWNYIAPEKVAGQYKTLAEQILRLK